MAQRPGPAARVGGASSGLEFRPGVHPAGLPGGGKTEDDAGDDGNRAGEQKETEIDVACEFERLIGQPELLHQRGEPGGDQHAKGAAEQRKQHAFGQQSAQQPGTAGTQRDAHGELAGPPRGARELQIGEIGAGDEQREGGDCEQQVQGLARVVHVFGKALGTGQHGELLGCVVGCDGANPCRERLHGDLGLLAGDAVLQAANDIVPSVVTGGERVFAAGTFGGELSIHRDWHIEVRHLSTGCPGELARGDADDGEGMTVDQDRAADHPGIGRKLGLPQAVAEHDDGRVVDGDAFVRGKGPAQRGIHPKHREIISGDGESLPPFTAGIHSEADGDERGRAEVFENIVTAFIVPKQRIVEV